MVYDDDLGQETFDFFGWVILGITANIASFDIFCWKITDINSDEVSWDSLHNGSVMHFNWLDFTMTISWSENDIRILSEDTSVNSSNDNCS